MADARRSRLPIGLSLIAIGVAVAGCATAPSGGPPRRAAGSSTQVQAYVQPLPPPAPTSARAWTPEAVVLGFLHASASYAFDKSAAERYLVPSLRRSWHPDNGPVAVVGGQPRISAVPYRPQIAGPALPGEQLDEVKFTGQRLATLTQTGQYQYTPGQDVEYQFILEKTDGVWRIQQLPAAQTGLLLTETDFEAVYQARNLFFYAPDPWQPAGVLVPDPVYAPLQSSNSALNTNLATGLVNGLLNGQGQGDWLSGATVSAFPKGSRLIKQVTITGHTAQVDLGGGAVHATSLQIQNMEAQLRATLDDGSYSLALANRVQLYINNKLKYENPAFANADLVSAVAVGPVFAVTGPSTVGQLPASPSRGDIAAAKLGPAQIGRAQITAIAAAPVRDRPPQIAVATQDGTGCAVQVRDDGQAQYRTYVLATKGGTCTSLSWDNSGNLWAAAGQTAWLLEPQNRHPIVVSMADLPDISQPGSSILALRMAPDSVRAAVLVHSRAGNKLFLAAVRLADSGAVSFGAPIAIGAGGLDPIAISWSDPYHLAVLADGTVFEVPLTGGAGLQPGGSPQSLETAPSGAQTLTTDGAELVVGSTDGHLFASSLASPGWFPVAIGSDPVYPG